MDAGRIESPIPYLAVEPAVQAAAPVAESQGMGDSQAAAGNASSQGSSSGNSSSGSTSGEKPAGAQAADQSPARGRSQMGVYPVKVGDASRAAVVEQGEEGYTASFPSPPRATASGATLLEAETRLALLVDLMA